MSSLREKLREEHGYAMVMIAISFSLLLGFMGLSIDMGMLFQEKREMQIAADCGGGGGYPRLSLQRLRVVREGGCESGIGIERLH
jgi:hypothetical protein